MLTWDGEQIRIQLIANVPGGGSKSQLSRMMKYTFAEPQTLKDGFFGRTLSQDRIFLGYYRRSTMDTADSSSRRILLCVLNVLLLEQGRDSLVHPE